MAYHCTDLLKTNLAACLGFTDTASGFNDDYRQTPNEDTDANISVGSGESSDDSVNSSDDADPLESKTDDAITPTIRLELRNAIQSRRISRGERELTVTFEPPKYFPLTPEEERKNQKRRERNKRSADRSREKRKLYTQQLEKEKERLDEEQNSLKTEVEALRKLKDTLESKYKAHLLCCPVGSKTPTASRYLSTIPEFSRLPSTATSSTAIGGQSIPGGQSVVISRSTNSSGSHQNNMTQQNQRTKSWLNCFAQNPLTPSAQTIASIPTTLPTQTNGQQIPQKKQSLIPTVVRNEESSSDIYTFSSAFSGQHRLQVPSTCSSQHLRYQNLENTPCTIAIQSQAESYPIDSSNSVRLFQADPMLGQTNLLQTLRSSVCEDVSESQEISEWKDGISENDDGSLMSSLIAGMV